MSDNESTNQSEQRSSGSGSGSQQRRRRRRRSRRRSSEASRTTTATPENSSQQTRKKKETPAGEKSTQRSSRRRRRKGSKGPSQHTKKQQQGSGKGGGQGRSKRSGSQRGGSPRRRHDGPRMETRNETSAGGLVISGLAEAVDPQTNQVDLSRVYVALIGRLDRRGRLLWSMPKGHVEDGEDNAKTAEREVWEETGIHGTVIADLGVIDYWFVSDGVRIHKTVHHHLLRYVDGILNDEDPEVTEVAWIPASELIEHLAYADERRLARIAHDQLPQLARAEHEAGRITPR